MDVTNVAELQDIVARNRPGDKIKVTFSRDGKTKSVSAILKNYDNEIKIVKSTDDAKIEGATFRNATKKELEELEIEGGVVIENLERGKWSTLASKKDL